MKNLLDLWIDENGLAVVLSPWSFNIFELGQSVPKVISVKQIHLSPCIAIRGGQTKGDHHDLPSVFVASMDMISSWSVAPSCADRLKYELNSALQIKQDCKQRDQYESGKTSLKLSLYTTPTALSFSIANEVSIIAISSENNGLALYKRFEQEHSVIDSRLLMIDNDDYEPISLITIDDNGEIFVWDIQEEQCIHKMFITTAKHSTLHSLDPLITLQTYQLHEGRIDGQLACTFLDELNVVDFNLIFNDKRDGARKFDVESINQIYQLKGSIPKALSFINTEHRTCILVTNKDICVIDCLQKNIVKKFSTETSMIDRNMNSKIIKVAVAFPFLSGILAGSVQPIFRYELDSISALVGAHMDGPNEYHSGDVKNAFTSLLMDDATKEKWIGYIKRHINECPDSTGSCQAQTTFKNRTNSIKSSGYGILRPKMKMGSAPSLLKQAQIKKSLKVKMAKKHKEDCVSQLIYPVTCNFLDSHQEQHDDNESHPILPPVSTLSFSPHGEFLSTAHNNAVVHVFKLPFSKYKSASYQISQTHPCSVEDNKILYPSCRPSWSTNYASGKKYLAHHNKIYCLSPNVTSMSIACELEKDTTNASFFSQDECILSTRANQIYLHRLSYDAIKNDKFTKSISFHPLHESRSGTLNSTFGFNAKRITCIASVNGSMANLVGCSCSDKSLQIIDVVQNKVLWSKPNCAGSRPAHSISFPQPSTNCPINSEHYNFIITASTDSGGLLSLFDLRCGDVVKTFRGHVNRKDQCMSSFSPCVRYVAVGGEGLCASASLYDLRGSTSPVKTKLGFSNQRNYPFRDGTVTDCQFNPIYPQLVTGSLSGQLRWYKERSR